MNRNDIRASLDDADIAIMLLKDVLKGTPRGTERRFIKEAIGHIEDIENRLEHAAE